jgi:hypothetical protein
MSNARKVLLTILIVGVTGSLAAFGVFSAYSATATNDNNSYVSGSVNIADNDAGSFLYQATNQGPGMSTQSCIHVTYTGSLASSVKLYLQSAVSNGTAFHLTVERGTDASPSFPDCTSFSATSIAYSGTLAAFPATYATGIDGKVAASPWATNDSVDYRFTISPVDDTTPNGHTSTLATGSHTYVWEARNN